MDHRDDLRDVGARAGRESLLGRRGGALLFLVFALQFAVPPLVFLLATQGNLRHLAPGAEDPVATTTIGTSPSAIEDLTTI
jgi:hypothetical protein